MNAAMLGLGDIDVDSPQLSPEGRAKLVQLIACYESIFSRHKLDCGRAMGFVHKIRLCDDRPFRWPYQRLSSNQHDRLRQALDEMEECEIIRKSNSEFASPLVLIWKKDDHPVPHQADGLDIWLLQRGGT